MGQAIEVKPLVFGEVAIFTADRSLTGQLGVGFDSEAEASAASGFPAALAAGLMSRDPALNRVFVASNQVLARRRGGWDGGSLGKAAATISRLFVFYPPSGLGPEPG